MPKAKHEARVALPAAVAFFLATGSLPPDGHLAHETGLVEAFRLKWSETLLDELAALWVRHREQIEAAAAPATPWVATVLADPHILDADEEEDDDLDEDDEE